MRLKLFSVGGDPFLEATTLSNLVVVNVVDCGDILLFICCVNSTDYQIKRVT